MHKKFMMACMAIAAFAAFVVAPTASASPVLTENGTAVAVGSSVESNNIEVTELKTSAGVVSCSSATLKGKVTKNSESLIKGEIPVGSASYSGTGTSGDCTSSIFGFPGSAKVTVNTKLCLEAGASDVLKVTGCSANFTFTIAFTGGMTCTYEASQVEGTYTTNATPAVGTIAGGTKGSAAGEASNNFACPSKGELFQKFNLTTTAASGGTGLTVS